MSGYFRFIPEIMVAYRVLNSSLCHFETPEQQLDFAFRYLRHRLLVAELLHLDMIKVIRYSLWKLFKLAVYLGELDIYEQKLKQLEYDKPDAFLNGYCGFITISLCYWVDVCLGNLYICLSLLNALFVNKDLYDFN